MSIRRVEVDYELSDLFSGQLEEVRLVGARWRVALSSDYKFNLGSLGELVRTRSSRPPPVKRLRWLDSLVVLDTPLRSMHVPFHGAAELGGGGAQLRLDGKVFDESLHLRASTHGDRWGGVLRGELLGEVRPSGKRNWLSLDASLERIGGERVVKVGLHGRRGVLPVHLEALEGALADVSGSLRVEMAGDEIREATGRVSASSALARNIRVIGPRLDIEREKDALVMELFAQVDQCRGALRASLSRRPQVWTSRPSLEGVWRMEGAIPEIVRDRFAQAGVDTTGLRLKGAGRSAMKRGNRGWQAQVHDSSATIAATTIALPKEGLSIAGPTALIRFDAQIEREGSHLTVRPASQLSASSLRWRALSIRASRRLSPALTLLIGDEAATLGWRASSLSWRGGDLSARLQASLRYGDTLYIRKLRGQLGLALKPDARILGSTLHARSMRVGKVELPGLRARIRGRPDYLRINASSRLTKAATLSANATLNRRGKRMRCPMTIHLPESRIAAKDRASALIQLVAPVTLAGSLALSARLDPCRPRSASQGQLRLSDVSASDIKGQVRLSGISGVIAFSRLSPARTKGWQEIHWTRTRLREREFGAGSLVVRVDSPGHFEIQRAKLDLGGGKLWTSAFTIDSKAPEIQATLFARDISLKRWLQVLSRRRVRGRGLFSGQLAVRLQWRPQLEFEIFSGKFGSNGSGHFTVNSRSWLRSALERYSEGFGASGGTSGIVKDRLIGALSDFEYSRLSAQIVEGSPQVLRVVTKGKGRQIPQVLDLRLNVTGIGDLINPAMRAWLANQE